MHVSIQAWDSNRNKTHLSLARDWGDVADLAAFDGVNDTALSDIRVSDETDRDLLLVGVQLGELAEELDEGALAKGVVGGGMEGDGRVARGEVLDVASLKTS